MCRHLAYVGPPIALRRVLTEPPHSLLHQSYAPTDMRRGGRISTEWAMNVRDQWREGSLVMVFRSMLQTFPQFINPTPPVIADLQFRRAMVHAIDRQQMVDTLQFGLTSVGHTFISPREKEYPDIESSIVKYDYDPVRSGQMIEALGYHKVGDSLFRDSAGEKLTVQIRTSQGDDRQGGHDQNGGDCDVRWFHRGASCETDVIRLSDTGGVALSAAAA